MPRKRARPYQIVQVPIDDDLLRRVDAAAGRVEESRAAYIREACRLRLENEAARRLDERYVAGYRRRPESRAWGALGTRLLAARLPKERW